ncbi:MAG: DNA-formamidopyrimidine glycosylase, partial [Acidimicrobiia bacterium]|nr:DNA-formamidopyrimidine glycosylase [Acidimicrobiia bacterium]
MPELPEVEVTRRLIAPSLEGSLIDEVEIRRERTARRNSGSAEVVDRLTGRTVERLGRKGKFIAADLDSGELLVIHLGMSGRLQLA